MSDLSVCPFASQFTLRDASQPPLSIWNDDKNAYEQAECVHSLVAHYAMTTPDATAAVCGDLSITYRELDQRSNRLARFLQSKGIGPDVVVALYLTRSVAMIVGALAVLKAGGAYLPLDPTSPTDRLKFLL